MAPERRLTPGSKYPHSTFRTCGSAAVSGRKNRVDARCQSSSGGNRLWLSADRRPSRGPRFSGTRPEERDRANNVDDAVENRPKVGIEHRRAKVLFGSLGMPSGASSFRAAVAEGLRSVAGGSRREHVVGFHLATIPGAPLAVCTSPFCRGWFAEPLYQRQESGSFGLRACRQRRRSTGRPPHIERQVNRLTNLTLAVPAYLGAVRLSRTCLLPSCRARGPSNRRLWISDKLSA
jgi:hypothetical protein